MALLNYTIPAAPYTWTALQTFNAGWSSYGAVLGPGPGGRGAWLNMPTTGPSGIGSGGAGVDAWIAYSQGNGQYIVGSQNGDIIYRNLTARMLFGNSGSEPASLIIGGNTVSVLSPFSTADSVSATATAGAVTITAAQILGAYFVDGATQTAPFTFTTDTAANLLTALPSAQVGSSFRFRFINNDQSSSGYAGTLTTGTGVTLGTALPNPAVPKGGYMDYLFVCTDNTTGSAAFTVTPVGGNSAGLL